MFRDLDASEADRRCWKIRTIAIAEPAATLPIAIICVPPTMPFLIFVDPLQPEITQTFPYPKMKSATTIMAIEKHNATMTWWPSTKKYGSSGTKPPIKYPMAIVQAHDIARDPEGSSSVC
jgi:hypothetical protein